MKRHGAGFVNYKGDQRQIIGEIKGPTTFGSPVIAVAAEYDESADRTRVAFMYARQEDLDTGVRDEFGIVRVPTIGADQ